MEAVLKRLDKASRDGDINKLKELLEEDELLLDTVLTIERNNPLHIAALLGHTEFTSEVLRLKPELASRLNREGMMPLHLAAARGHLQVAQILVDKVGKEICLIPDRMEGLMAVHIATVNGKHHVVKMLVERYRELLKKKTKNNENLLHLAVRANNLDFIRYFVDEGINLNEKNADENTCLHLAVANRNSQVITYLLDQVGIEVNSRNAMGLTPLDVLLVSSLGSVVDISLVNTIRIAGGVGSRELSDLESNTSTSTELEVSAPSSKPAKWPIKKEIENMQSEAQTLLLVATLVATMTFQGISNPPGGFIQPQFDYSNSATLSTWIKDWEYMHMYPAGQPVLLWELQNFYILDSVAMFSSVSVILWLLIAVPKTKLMMKILVAIVWFSAFCAALAFGSVLLQFGDNYFQHSNGSGSMSGYTKGDNYYRPPSIVPTDIGDYHIWLLRLLFAWFLFYIAMGLWASVRAIRFLWGKAGFKIKLPNWISKVGWPKTNKWFNRITYIAFMLCVVAVFCFATFVIFLLFRHIQ